MRRIFVCYIAQGLELNEETVELSFSMKYNPCLHIQFLNKEWPL